MIPINSKCLRVIYIILLVAVVIGVLVTNFIVFPSFTEMLVQRTENNAEQFGKYMGEYVFPEYYGAIGLDPEIIAHLEDHADDLNLYKLKVFSRRGETVYSTDRQEIGDVNTHEYFKTVVAKGSLFSKSVQKEAESLEGKKVKKDVVEVYVPIMRYGFFVGALELYYDVTSEKKGIQTNLLFCNALFFGFVFLFMGVLLFVLLKLDGVLEDRKKAYKDLKRFNVDLQGEIKERKRVEKKLARVNEELEKIALIDGLTEIANRRQFDIILQQEWQRMAREKQELTLILCDIDYFKKYNDTYGHAAGDECLIKVAQCIQSTLKRPGDLAARYGGEEFAVVLPNTSFGGALKLAQDIQIAVSRLAIPHSQSEANSHVSLSIGISSTIPTKGIFPKSLIEGADSALYAAKDEGRNQIRIDLNSNNAANPDTNNKRMRSMNRAYRLMAA